MRRALFICGKGTRRSPTAEQTIKSRKDWDTDSAGLGATADAVVCAQQIAWGTAYRAMAAISAAV